MSKPFTNPFFEADISKLFDASKMSGEWRMPSWPTWNAEAWATAQRKNIEAYTAMNQAAWEGMQSLMRRQTEWFRQSWDEASQTVSAITTSPTPEEKIIKQAEASKAAFDKCLANARDIAETMAKVNNQAMETVRSRASESLEEWREIIKTNRAA